MSRVATSRWAVVASATLVVATPVVAWWLMGDQSEDVARPDHLVAPLTVSPGVERAVGIAAVAVAAVSAAVVVHARWRGRFSRRWFPTVVLLVIPGVMLGVGWRVVTAGTAGVGTRAGLVLVFGLPLLVAVVGAAVLTGLLRQPRRRRRRQRRRRRSKGTHIRDDTPVSSADRV